jgi:hypothetical protein
LQAKLIFYGGAPGADKHGDRDHEILAQEKGFW